MGILLSVRVGKTWMASVSGKEDIGRSTWALGGITSGKILLLTEANGTNDWSCFFPMESEDYDV